MRKKKTIQESFRTTVFSILSVLLFFGTLLIGLWAIIILAKLMLG